MSSMVTSWIGTAVGAVLCGVPLTWTLVVFHRHRPAWAPLDVLLVALLWQGGVQLAGALLYATLALLGPAALQWCSAATWLLVSGHTLQAGTLATMVVTRLLRVRLSPSTYVTTVTRTHLIYHLISLTLLSACVGITAVLARERDRPDECSFLPHELDPRYAVLSLALQTIFLAASALVAGVTCCLRRPEHDAAAVRVSTADDGTPSSTVARRACFAGGGGGGRRRRQGKGRHQALFTSSSDLSSALSDFSSASGAKTFWNYCGPLPRSEQSTLGKDDVDANPPSITFLNGLPPGYPPDPASDGDTLQKTLSPLSALRSLHDHRYRELCSGDYSDSTLNRDFGLRANNNKNNGSNNWNSDNSYMSTTTSPTSTNSRAPCLSRQPLRGPGPPLALGCYPLEEAPAEELRLPTALAVLVLCYVTNHIPVLAASGALLVRPGLGLGLLPASVSLHALALWGAEIQACLLPVVLAIFDDRFGPWVARLYARAKPRKPPLQSPRGGKFQPYDLEVVTQALRQQQQQQQTQQQHQNHQPLHSQNHLPQHQSPHQPYENQQKPLQLQHQHLVHSEQHHQHLQQHLQLQNDQQQKCANLQSELQTHGHTGHQPKFPITNGSLFTSLDGHIPIVHNYRRRRDMQMGTTYVPVHQPGGHYHAPHNKQPPSQQPQQLQQPQQHQQPTQHSHHYHHQQAVQPPQQQNQSNHQKNQQQQQHPQLLHHQHQQNQQQEADQKQQQEPEQQIAGSELIAKQAGFALGSSLEDIVTTAGITRRCFGSDEMDLHLRRNLLSRDHRSLDSSGNATEASLEGDTVDEDELEEDEDEEDEDEREDDDEDDEPIYATLSSGCSVTTAANDDFEFYQHVVSKERPSGVQIPATHFGYQKLTKKPRGPDLDTTPPPPPPPLPQTVLEARYRHGPTPGYQRKRQGFHELELARQTGKPLTTADLLEFYNSSSLESSSGGGMSDEAADCGSSPGSPQQRYQHKKEESQPVHQPLRKTASGRTLDSDDDGRGIYSYHDVIRGCQLDDLSLHSPPLSRAASRSAAGRPPPGAGHHHHPHGLPRRRHAPAPGPPAPAQAQAQGAQPQPQHYPSHSLSSLGPPLLPHHEAGRKHLHPHGDNGIRLERGWSHRDALALPAPVPLPAVASRRRAASTSQVLDGLEDDADDESPAGRRQAPHNGHLGQPHGYGTPSHAQQGYHSSMSSMLSASGSRDPLLANSTDSFRQEPPRHCGYHRQAPPSRGHSHATPPSRRRVACRQKKSVARVLSLDSLHLALQDAATVSYLDTGDVCSHHVSQPDLHRVFVSDFI